MQYLALYIVLFTFVLLCFVRGKHVLFNIILMTYPTAVIYKAIIGYAGTDFLNKMNFGASEFTMHTALFILVLIPVYISMIRIVNEFKLHHSLKGVAESIVLSLGIVLLTIGVCFHVLPDKDVFNLGKPFEVFFQTNLGYLVCVIVPMISVFILSKQKFDIGFGKGDFK
ncbi:MAG: hypothetical protein V4686_01460 [Patescibacteria group bacterium]